MHKLILLWFFMQAFSPALPAQWTLHADQTAEYECSIETVDNGIPYTFLDTFLFDVQRKVQGVGKGWAIGYNILKTYPFGTFRNESPHYNPSFLVDRQGRQNLYPPLPEKLSRLERQIGEFLGITLIPYPAQKLQLGGSWTAAVRGESLEFSVSESLQEKLGRSCYEVYFDSQSSTLEGSLLLEKNTGQWVAAAWKTGPYACGNCTSKGYRIQLSLRAPGGRIAEKIEAFAEGETEKKRLQQAYQWVIPLVYNQIWSYSEGNDHRGYVVQANKTFGWLDELGNILLPPVYRRIERAGGQMMQVDAGNRCFLADSTGKILVDSLDGISTSCGIGEFTQEVKKKGVYLGVDGQGNILYTQKQAGYSSLSDRTRDGKTWMVSGENSGLIQGERVIIPAVYPFFRFLGNGLISAHKDSMGYLFNLDGDTLLSRKGGAIETMSGDFATISREGLFKWKTQQLIYPGQDVGYIMYNWDSAFIYQDDDRYFYLLFNRQGQLLGTFKNVIPGLNGDAVIVTDTVAQLFGIVDFQGKILVQPQYKTLSSLDNGIFIAERENSEGYSYYGLLSTNGEVILPFDCKRLQYLESGKYYLERRVKKTYLQNHWNMPFNSIWLMDLPEDNWYRYEQDLQYGVFDILTRKFTALPPGVTLDYALRYNKGVFLKVKKNDLMGLMDLDLAELVPIAFKEVGPMGRFGVVVSSQGKMGVIKLK